MKKFFLALLMVLCLLGVASAGAEKLTFDVISATCEIDSGYIIITPANMSAHPDWIAKQQSDLETLQAEFQAKGILAQAWSKSGDVCIEITAVQDSLAKEYFDVDQHTTVSRSAYRKQHLNGAQFKSEGYSYSEAEWKNLTKGGRFLELKYKYDHNGESHKGFARRTVRNGYTVTIDYKVFGRSLKNTDNSKLTNLMKTWEFFKVLEKPLDVVSKVKFENTPPAETDTGKFTVDGTCDPGLHFTGVLMRMSSPDPILIETTASEKGKFSMAVDLPAEGVWLMTLTVDNQGEVTEEIVFETTTYQDTLLPVNFDDDVPLDFEVNEVTAISGDTLTISGTTIRNVKIQCIVGDWEKQVTTNASGKFSFKVPTDEEGEYKVVLNFQKKNYNPRRFTATAQRTLTEEDIKNAYREEACKPAHTTLTEKIKGYTGRIMGYELYYVDKTQREEDGKWVLTMGMRTSSKTKSGYRDIVYVVADEEPAFAIGSKQKMYGKCIGEMELDGKDYPGFELLFWDGEITK